MEGKCRLRDLNFMDCFFILPFRDFLDFFGDVCFLFALNCRVCLTIVLRRSAVADVRKEDASNKRMVMSSTMFFIMKYEIGRWTMF